MPGFIRRNMKKQRKKLLKKTRTFKKARTYVPSKSFGQPRTKYLNLPYQTTVALSGAVTGAANYNIFRANSIFDPDYSGVGHQPLGHDQWNLFYNHYIVQACKITVSFACPAVTTPFYVGIALTDDVISAAIGSTTNFSTAAENRHIRYRLVTTQDSGKTITLSYNANVLKFLGRSSSSDDVKTTFGNNPTEQAFYQVFVMPVNVSYDAPSVWAAVSINYKTKLVEPKELTSS